MANTQNTQWKSNDEASEIRRLLGRANYYCDFDDIMSNEDNIESSGMMYTFEYGKRKTVAIIDYKQGIAQDIPCKQNMEAIKQQAHFATNEMKTPLPFFIILTYLLDEHETKMYYTMPCDKAARKIIKKPRWMTLFEMSRFECFLRGKRFDPEEVINQDRLLAKYGFPSGMKLKDLPNIIVEYPLPRIDMDFINAL